MRQSCARAALFLYAVFASAAGSPLAAQTPDPIAHLDSLIAAADTRLREGELQVADSNYRAALNEGWIMAGALAAADGQLPAAIDAFRPASTMIVDPTAAVQLLAIAYLQHGDAKEAVAVLSEGLVRRPDAAGRRL